MNIKRGTTPDFVFNIKDLNVDEVQEVIFTFISESNEALDPITIEEPETNEFVIGLTQQQSLKLKGATEIEAQINYKDKHQEKTKLAFYYVDDTLGTKIVEGNKPNTDNPEAIELILEIIKGDVALVITPEASDELIDAVTAIFNDTKDVADSVRQDADNGEFDGQDGYSPQVTVKTETPSTYVLHIKDADHEYDTPNLQGQGGEGSIEVGDGLKRVGNTVSVALGTGELLSFTNGKLELFPNAIYLDTTIRYGLTQDYGGNDALASKSYVDTLAQALGNALSISIDSQTYVMTLQLKHNNQVLSTGTVDLPLETMVVDADYDSQTKEIVLTLQSGSTVRFSVADLVSGLQTEITAQNKLSTDLVDDTNSTNKFVPTSTSADNGKFLRVVNGVATWQTVPQAESNSF